MVIFFYRRMKRIEKSGVCPLLGFMLMILLGIWAGLPGCGYFPEVNRLLYGSDAYNADLITLQRGNRALRNGDYQKALEIYRMLSQLARREKIRRQALYGMACAQLILAEDEAEMETSITLWDAWSGLITDEPKTEDPRLLKALLEQKTESKRAEASKLLEPKPRPPKTSPHVLEEKDEEIKKLQTQIKGLKSELRELAYQLECLEAIDQKIQEKKKEIALP